MTAATPHAKRLGRPHKVRPVTIRSVEMVRESPTFVVEPDANLARQYAWELEGIAARATEAHLVEVANRAAEIGAQIKTALTSGGVALCVAQINGQAVVGWAERQLGYAAANAGRRQGARKETSFDDLAMAATAFLDLPTNSKRAQRAQELRHGIGLEPINRGLDVLECRGVRVEDVRKWRERKGATADSPWRLSPGARDLANLNTRDAAWFERLRRAFPETFA